MNNTITLMYIALKLILILYSALFSIISFNFYLF